MLIVVIPIREKGTLKINYAHNESWYCRCFTNLHLDTKTDL